MFKTQFNTLYSAIMAFVLEEKNIKTFNDPISEIRHYKSVVDEYNDISFNLKNIISQIDKNSELYNEIVDITSTLNNTLDNYKTNVVTIRVYLHELETMEIKTTFTNSLYRFEKSLVSEPLIKVDVSKIQEIVELARIFTKNTSNFYYYTNNPYEVDASLNIIIPIKYSFTTADTMLTSVYNYMYALYNHYIGLNSAVISTMSNLESAIEEQIIKYTNIFNNAKQNKIIITFETTSLEYYNTVENIKSVVETYTQNVIGMGIYRFSRLITIFEDLLNDVSLFISEYESNELYVFHSKVIHYESLLNKLNEYVIFIEDGKVNAHIDYIITNFTLKDVVDEIIELSKSIKQKIVYTQEYHDSGVPTTLEFEFYQTEMFLNSIKTYYYKLMVEHIYRYSNITIDDFGDGTLDVIRDNYKSELANYNKYIAPEINHLNNFEFDIYYQNVIKIQQSLKYACLLFFDSAAKISPSTYIEVIEKQYLSFIEKLNDDLINIKKNRTLDVLQIIDVNKIESEKRLVSFNTHVDNMEIVLLLSKKYIFLGSTNYIQTYIYDPSKLFLEELTYYYNKENYLEVLNIYNTFYTDNIINFNLLYAFESLSNAVNELFSKIDVINDLYINEYSNDKFSLEYNESILILDDLFGDETYKVVRSELFYKLDMVYEFVISTRPNEKTYLINEKNLKKLYFDNQMMKLNYIRWYHKILFVFERYKLIDKDMIVDTEVYKNNKKFIENFEHKVKINSMVAVQNKTLASITKIIVDASTDSNYSNIEFNSDIIKNIEIYNRDIQEDFDSYVHIIDTLINFEAIRHIDDTRHTLYEEHKNQWINIIVNNNIIEPEKVSYNEMDIFTGSIPFTVELKAKIENSVDATGDDIEATYKWYIGSVMKEGNEVSHTFFNEGRNIVRCEIIYESGETFSRYLEFELTGPQNTHIVKSGTVNYSPLKINPSQPKITYTDSNGECISIPLSIDGNLEDMLKNGALTFESVDLIENNGGVVIVGFIGEEFAGEPFNYKTIFEKENFEYPTESEFLFDFKVTAPLSGNISVDINQSKYTTFMTKIPDDIVSIYEIKKASEYVSAGTNLKITSGDKLIFKNTYGRYAIIEIKDIQTFSTSEKISEDGITRYYYEIEIDYFVNTSLNTYDRDEFQPEETSLVVPTLVFKTDVRELFNSLIDRLEEINILRDRLTNAQLDVELSETIMNNINILEEKNNDFYLFEELDKIKSKYYSLNTIFKGLNNKFKIDYTKSIQDMCCLVDEYKDHINNTKTFEEYINGVHAYDFTQNIIDVEVLVNLFKDQKTVLEILISTYEYKKYNMAYYAERLKSIQLFDTEGFVDESLPYGKMLIQLVLKLRSLLFKLKTIINFSIMTTGQYVVMTGIYYRLQMDSVSGIWSNKSETDLFLLNKKLELKYGYEIGKIESGLTYKDFVSDVVADEKRLFGRGLTSTDIKDISNYIQVVESKLIGEYDDFFMIPFWLDYLEKNV